LPRQLDRRTVCATRTSRPSHRPHRRNSPRPLHSPQPPGGPTVMNALVGLLRKEWFHIRRDRRTAAVLIALPVVQVLLFGYAIRTDVDNVRLAVVDPAPDSATIALRNRFAAGAVFRTVAVVPRTSDLDPLFES